jgi:hypothetical protein
VEIQGAVSFQDAHSSHVITSSQAPADLTSAQVAVNFATNTASGDVVRWDGIDPGPDGTFTVVCSQYQGFVPNGGRSNGTNGYAITGIRLEELPTGPPVFTMQPQNVSVLEGGSATFTGAASGQRPISYQWLRNGSPVAGATATNLTLLDLTYLDSKAQFSLFASNTVGTATSSNATLTVSRPPFIVLPLTNAWKYNQDGIELPDTWRASDYDDSSWAEGRGVLARETDNQTVLPLTNTVLSFTNRQGQPVGTCYFRTHLQLTNDLEQISLFASNLVDDGAVFYLNGQEFYRYNLPAAPAVIRYVTQANTVTEAAWLSNSIPTTNILMGDNVLAVELHQLTPNSADAVFGLQIMGFFPDPTPLSIASEPGDLVVEEERPATLSIGTSGKPAYVQWFSIENGTPVAIPGATRRELGFVSVSTANAGQYFALVSNSVNQVTSRVATLTVLIDNTPPRLTTAEMASTAQTVLVTFSENILAETATNVGNYTVTNLSSGGLASITSLVLTNGTNVLLTLATPRNFNDNYLVVVSNIQDVSPHRNPVAQNSATPIQMVLPLIGLNQPGWAFYNPVFGPPTEPYDPPLNWNQVDFEVPTDSWGQDAAGLFAYNPVQRPLPAPVNTVISGGAIASYYRFPFIFEGSPSGARLLLRRIHADGLVGYLNGREIERINLPSGTIDPFTPSVTNVVDAIDATASIAAEANVNYGSNVFAAELHGYSTSDDSLVFGAELTAQILSWARGPIVITSGPQDVTVLENRPAQFEITAVGARGVDWRTNGVLIQGANTFKLTIDPVPLALDGTTVDAKATNADHIMFSGIAQIHVIPDTDPPLLLNATIASNGVVLTFDEPLLYSSVTNLQNYRLTNNAGTEIVLIDAQPLDLRRVLLVMDDPPSGDLVVVVHGIRDASEARNEINANTMARVGFDIAIPIDAVWRYNTNGTDLGTMWRSISFPDNTPDWPTGAGLIADETGPLPAAINTPISRLVNGQYHFTFYFRYRFRLPFAPASVPVTFRHVIDDGALMYINGQQFHNFNMPTDSSSVNYNTQASSMSVGDAVYSGPYTAVFTNLVVGDNVIAVEVHQNGTVSSDVTFGAEFFAHVPSIVYPGTPRPKLFVARNGAEVTIFWPGTGFTLEGSDTLGTNATWSPLASQTNSYRTFPSGSQQFFRLRQ